MPEIKREVRPVEINYVCDACGNGMLAAEGEMNSTSGAQEHRCLICDHRQVFHWVRYPRIEHLGLEDEL